MPIAFQESFCIAAQLGKFAIWKSEKAVEQSPLVALLVVTQLSPDADMAEYIFNVKVSDIEFLC